MGCGQSVVPPPEISPAEEKRLKDKWLHDQEEERKRHLGPLTPVIKSSLCKLEGFEWTQAIERECKAYFDYAKYCITNDVQPDMKKSTPEQAWISFAVYQIAAPAVYGGYGVKVNPIYFEHSALPAIHCTVPIPPDCSFVSRDRMGYLNATENANKFRLYAKNYCMDFNHHMWVTKPPQTYTTDNYGLTTFTA